MNCETASSVPTGISSREVLSFEKTYNLSCSLARTESLCVLNPKEDTPVLLVYIDVLSFSLS